MQPSAAASSPACVLLVVSLANSMAGPKLDAALRLVGATLGELVQRLRRGAAGLDAWQAGVVGVHAGEPVPLLAGASAFVSLAQLAAQGVHLQPARPASAGGVLADAGRLLRAWMGRHERSGPPVVVCCTDESADAESFLLHSRSLRLLAGPPAVVVCGFSSDPAVIPFPARPDAVRGVWRALWRSSSAVHVQGRAGRAFGVNDQPAAALARLVQAHAGMRAEQTRRWPAGAPVRCDSHVLWAPRDGNSDDEWEDGFAVDGDCGVAAVADGASQSIFARRWADTLTRRFVAELPDLADPAARALWLAGCRADWLGGVGYNDLHGLQQDKVDRIGGNATFLALQLRRSAEGVRWRAAAVGDACLLWGRGRKLQAAFPLMQSREFGIAPDLASSVPQRAREVRILTAGSPGREGDWFGLATDATAQFLLRCHEQAQAPDWRRYWDMDLEAWRRYVEQQRQRGWMSNDDATLVMLRLRS